MCLHWQLLLTILSPTQLTQNNKRYEASVNWPWYWSLTLKDTELVSCLVPSLCLWFTDRLNWCHQLNLFQHSVEFYSNLFQFDRQTGNEMRLFSLSYFCFGRESKAKFNRQQVHVLDCQQSLSQPSSSAIVLLVVSLASCWWPWHVEWRSLTRVVFPSNFHSQVLPERESHAQRDKLPSQVGRRSLENSISLITSC